MPISGSGPNPLAYVQASLTTAQILGKTSVVIVAAPGAGVALVPVSIAFVYVAGGTPFTVDGTTVCALDPGAGAGMDWAVNNGVGFLDQAATTCAFKTPIPQVRASTNVDNQPLQVNWTGTAPTLGTGSMRVAVSYVSMRLT